MESNGEKKEVAVKPKTLGAILLMSHVNLGCVRPLRFAVLWWYHGKGKRVPQILTLLSNTKKNISKSNKSELWNRLSYRDLPYFFEGLGNETAITIYSRTLW